ncbi:MAG: hypothetical protein F4X55_03560 [Candidatus Dadabacteria bacterium]|nr:hypothetical protein [Candidatus Dadabacteria bacterium]MYC40072.1 hypothetical protein [Candidatus Dadabacteria bacterium]
MSYTIPINLGPILPRGRRTILRIILALEALGCSLQVHTRGSLIPVDIITEFGLYNGIMTSFSFYGILAVLTWLLFYYWDWIRHDSNQWEFRQSIPELEHAIETLTAQSIQAEQSGGFDPPFLSPKDSLKVDMLLARLERLNLSRLSDENQISYLTRILDYAQNKTYKECQAFEKFMETPF